jgi:hypothetical protein
LLGGESFADTLKNYQWIQHLSLLYAEIHQKLVIPFIVLFNVSMIVITGLIVFIKFWNIIPLPLLALAGLSAGDGIFIMFIGYGTMAGQIYKMSTEIIHKCRNKPQSPNEKWIRRKLKATQPIKIRIAAVNYFEGSTVFVILDFNFRTAITAMLVL